MCARVRSITFACMEVVGWKDDIPEDCNATSRRGGVAGDVGELATARQVFKKTKKKQTKTKTKLSVLSVVTRKKVLLVEKKATTPAAGGW